LQLSKLEKIANVLGMNLQNLLGLNDANIFNVAETCANSGSHCTVVLSETQCAHELEKCRLLLRERDKEICHLKEIIELLKNNSNLQDGNAK
jgi:hypothetical protein